MWEIVEILRDEFRARAERRKRARADLAALREHRALWCVTVPQPIADGIFTGDVGMIGQDAPAPSSFVAVFAGYPFAHVMVPSSMPQGCILGFVNVQSCPASPGNDGWHHWFLTDPQPLDRPHYTDQRGTRRRPWVWWIDLEE